MSEFSAGFEKDCFKLIDEFKKHKTAEFKYFCHEWKKMNFQFIFCGRQTDADLIEFTSEALLIAKHLFLKSSESPLDRIGALYILYAMYFKQPTFQFCKIRICMNEWIEIRKFLELNNHPDQVTLIVWKLFISDAFRFVENEMEYGFETFFLKGARRKSKISLEEPKKQSRFKNFVEHEIRNLKSLDGILSAMNVLETAYNEMKDSLQENETGEDRMQQSTFVGEVRKEFDGLLDELNQKKAGENSGVVSEHKKADSEIGKKRKQLRQKALFNIVEDKRYESPAKSDRKKKPAKKRNSRSRKKLESESDLSLTDTTDVNSD
uniref:Putative small nuclear rna activating complex snapc subunit snap43 n=1 Tax=Corethrella appendiculata TaxID=1370023 RepID=U5EH85_9DIPT